MPRTDFVSDLVDEIERYFEEHHVQYKQDASKGPVELLERYFYTAFKMITPCPRRVHYSAELETTLGTLDKGYVTPIETIRSRFERGTDLSEFLNEGTSDAKFNDGLLSDFGVHHFHLGTKAHPKARKVRRTRDLLFVHVQHFDACFLDVRKHPNNRDPGDFGWCDTDLLNIIDSNWPEVLEPYIIPGVKGNRLTGEQRKELRRKNVNVVWQVGGKAIAPPGGGLLADGSNAMCKWQAMKLLFQIREIEQIIKNHWDDCNVSLQGAGMDISDTAELRLVRIGGTNIAKTSLDSLTGDLSWSGWGIAEATSGTLIDWSFNRQ